MTTIRHQLTRKLLLAIALLLGVGGITVYLCARAALLAQFDAGLRAKAQAITTLTEQKGSRIELDFDEEFMRGFDEHTATDFFELWHADGRLIAHSRSLRQAHLPRLAGTLDAPLFGNIELPDGKPGRAVGLRFRPPPSDAKTRQTAPLEAVLVVASNCRDLDRTLATLALVLGGCGVLLLLATALVVPRLLGRELRPLQQLAEGAARIDAASLSARFPTAGLPGELAPISGRLNELLARLEDAFERERRFSADVAHEFRTPVAELRSMAELALKLPDARAANSDQEILAIALHLESILTRLLALARGEHGDLPVQRERIALAPLVQEVCGKFQAKAAPRQLALHCRVSATAHTETDLELLRSILTNLVDNAVEYAPRGGAIEIEAGAPNGRFTLRVVNAVEHLEERDLPRLFERFWRKDAARTADGHTGLGLALARTYARALGCELTATFAGPSQLALTLVQIEPKSRNKLTLDTGRCGSRDGG